MRGGRGTLLGLLLLGGCVEAPGPDVVLVTLDTVRADHLGSYGYALPTSPNLDALAATADRYENALASSPWTVPTHASLFTGLFPFQHRAHSFPIERGDRPNVYALSDAHTTLAEVLRAAGYRTAAFASNEAYLRRGLGFERGFEIYQVGPLRARRINRAVFRWLRQQEGPFFLFVNYMDAHRPYNTEPGPPGLPTADPAEAGALLDELKGAVMGAAEADPALLADLRRRVVAQYDLGIAHSDAALGALLDELRAQGRFRDAIVVVTSDHGEYFGEHGLVEHSKDVYQEALRVPLVVKAPGQREGRVLAETVTSVDLPRLIAARAPARLRARLEAHFPYEPGNHPVLAENYYTRSLDLVHPEWGARFGRVRVAFFAGDHKLIHSSDGRHELYDLREDPGESRDLAGSRPELAASLQAELEGFREPSPSAEPPPPPVHFSDDELERLRELGYL